MIGLEEPLALVWSECSANAFAKQRAALSALRIRERTSGAGAAYHWETWYTHTQPGSIETSTLLYET